MAHKDLHHAHAGVLRDGDARHGFITLHPYDAAKTTAAQTAVRNAAAGPPQDPVTVNSVHDLVVVLVEDKTNPAMFGTDFHLYLARLAAKYVALPETSVQPWFSFEKHF